MGDQGTLKPAALKLALDLVKDHLGEMPHVIATSLVSDGKQTLQELGRSTVRGLACLAMHELLSARTSRGSTPALCKEQCQLAAASKRSYLCMRRVCCHRRRRCV